MFVCVSVGAVESAAISGGASGGTQRSEMTQKDSVKKGQRPRAVESQSFRLPGWLCCAPRSGEVPIAARALVRLGCCACLGERSPAPATAAAAAGLTGDVVKPEA